MGTGTRHAPDFTPREVVLAGGKSLTIRPVRPADVDALAALYDGLSSDDRYRRFFSGYRPDERFLEKMTATADRGGCVLVAAVCGGGAGEREIVAEAGYNRLPDGDGELGMTVADGWRGWLGPYQLDALLEVAAAQGVPNLQADVLVSNRPMFALLGSRGYATIANRDWPVVRVLVGTVGRTPSWPGSHDRPRVLVEVPGGRWHAEAEARAAGLQVLACTGPKRGHVRCPALCGTPCPLAASADVIVLSHALDEPRWHAVRDAHERLHRGVPVCVEPVHRATDLHSWEHGAPRHSAADVVDFVHELARGNRRTAHLG